MGHGVQLSILTGFRCKVVRFVMRRPYGEGQARLYGAAIAAVAARIGADPGGHGGGSGDQRILCRAPGAQPAAIDRRHAAAAGAHLQAGHGGSGGRRWRGTDGAAGRGAQRPDVRGHRPAAARQRGCGGQLSRRHRGPAAALHRLSRGASGAGRPQRGAGGCGRGARSGGGIAPVSGGAAQQLSVAGRCERAAGERGGGGRRPFGMAEGAAWFARAAAAVGRDGGIGAAAGPASRRGAAGRCAGRGERAVPAGLADRLSGDAQESRHIVEGRPVQRGQRAAAGAAGAGKLWRGGNIDALWRVRQGGGGARL